MKQELQPNEPVIHSRYILHQEELQPRYLI